MTTLFEILPVELLDEYKKTIDISELTKSFGSLKET